MREREGARVKRHDEGDREAAVREFLAGERASVVASRHGVAQNTVYTWVSRHLSERDARADEEAAEREAVLRRRRAVMSCESGQVVLLELSHSCGRTLAMADVARDGSQAGTVRAVAGDPLPRGGRVVATRRWAVDAMALARLLAAAIGNMEGRPADQRGMARMMGVGE